MFWLPFRRENLPISSDSENKIHDRFVMKELEEKNSFSWNNIRHDSQFSKQNFWKARNWDKKPETLIED